MRTNSKYDAKMRRQHHNHTAKIARLRYQDIDSFKPINHWNPDASGSIAITLLLLLNCATLANARPSYHSMQQSGQRAQNVVCPAIHNGTSSLSTEMPFPIQAIEATIELSANRNAVADLSECFWANKYTKRAALKRGCVQHEFNRMPDYGDLKIWKDWYKNVEYFPFGRAKHILIATLNHGRKYVSSNTKILILTSALEHYWYAQDLLSYCEKFSILSNYKGKPIVGFYPEIFGAYKGNHFPVDLLPTNMAHHISIHNKRIASNMKMSYLEMEYFENTYTTTDLYQDSIVFETDISEWGSRKIAGCVQGDDGPRHRLLVQVSYYRAYHIGADIYLFAPGPMPKMIDLDTTVCGNFSEVYSSRYSPKLVLSDDAKRVVTEMGEKGIFNVFSLYFSKYKVSNINTIPSNVAVRHYYIPDEHLERI